MAAHSLADAAFSSKRRARRVRRTGSPGKTALGTARSASYNGEVSGFLRFVGVVNAAIWLGGGIFFAMFILPAVFSENMRNVFHVAPGADSNYYPGAIALLLFRKFFLLQYICGVVAFLHLFAEKLYLGRPLPRLATTIVVVIFLMSLIGGVWLQPRMEALRQASYSTNATAEQREAARRSFGAWHGVSQLANVVILAGLVAHLMRVTRPDDSKRYISFSKFWG